MKNYKKWLNKLNCGIIPLLVIIILSGLILGCNPRNENDKKNIKKVDRSIIGYWVTNLPFDTFSHYLVFEDDYFLMYSRGDLLSKRHYYLKSDSIIQFYTLENNDTVEKTPLLIYYYSKDSLFVGDGDVRSWYYSISIENFKENLSKFESLDYEN